MENINRKWIDEDQRVFSVYPGTPHRESGVLWEEDAWLEMAQYFQDDLRWLLSLEHHKFWSHMIYSDQVHSQLVVFLKECPPNYLRSKFFVRQDMKDAFCEIEHLVFLIFLRLSTEEESKSCYLKNLGEILYNNYIFTVPIILDICLIYGTSNRELVKKMINDVIRVAPDFLNDFQEMIPHFFQVLKTVKGKFSVEHLPKLKERVELKWIEIRDMGLYLHDSVATVQVFLDLYPKACQMFPKTELVIEVVGFYANVLPEMHSLWEKKREKTEDRYSVSDLIENTRLDLIKVVKMVLDSVLSKSNELSKRKEELVDEYLTLMMELLTEPLFLTDFNRLYPIEYEIGSVTNTCADVDTIKVDHILDGLALVESKTRKDEEKVQRLRMEQEEAEVSGVKLNSLVTEVKDILPHLEEAFIRDCLRCYDYNTERVIAAILENSVQVGLDNSPKADEQESESEIEHRGKHKYKYRDLIELLDDREEILEMKERYTQLVYVPDDADDAYDDEYDDTYDENISVPEKEGEDAGRRPFVVPRVLRTVGEEEEEEEEEDEEETEAKNQETIRDAFVENPAEARERMERRRADQMRRDVVGRERGKGQNKEVLRNRVFKGTHKAVIANHNRKKQASRKMNRGMLPP